MIQIQRSSIIKHTIHLGSLVLGHELGGVIGLARLDRPQVAGEGLEERSGSREQGAGSRELGAGSREQGAGSREQGWRDKCLMCSAFLPWVSPIYLLHTDVLGSVMAYSLHFTVNSVQCTV